MVTSSAFTTRPAEIPEFPWIWTSGPLSWGRSASSPVPGTPSGPVPTVPPAPRVTSFVLPPFAVCVVPSKMVPAQVISGKALAGAKTATPFVRSPVGTSKAIVCGAPEQF
jgi:hypothetical protein